MPGNRFPRSHCEVCRGSGTISLPLYPRIAMSYADDGCTAISPGDVPIRSYPCPECSPKVSEEQVAVLTAGVKMAVHPTNEHADAIADMARKECAHELVDALLRGGYIEFEIGPVDTSRMQRRMRATLGAVSKAAVASLEDRIAAHQAEVAREVAQLAQQKIAVWGSSYSGFEGSVSKGRACEAVQEVLNDVLKKQKAGA